MGRQVMQKMWRVKQEHNVIGMFYYTRVLQHRVFFFGCFAATQLWRQLQQERTQVVSSNKEVQKRLTVSII
jgi:hypothetical protein